MMTLDIIQKRLVIIAESAGDFEIAHEMEGRLHRAVLRAIANGTCIEPEECARLALTSQEIKFTRYCA